jgi:hypothetical protein
MNKKRKVILLNSDSVIAPLLDVAIGALGGQINGSGSVLATLPAVITPGMLLLYFVENKYPAAVPSDIAGWVKLGSGSGGAGASGPDAGQVQMTVFGRIADGLETPGAAVTCTIPGGNSASGRIYSLTKDPGFEWSVLVLGGADNTGGSTVWSIVTAATQLAAKDIILAASGSNIDTTGFGTLALSQPGGAVFGAITKSTDSGTGNGDDSRLVVGTCQVTTPGSNSAITYTMVGSTFTADSVSGYTLIVRVRQVAASTLIDEWDPDTSVDSVVTTDGTTMWTNPAGLHLRSSIHYTPRNPYSIVTRNTHKRFRYWIDPRDPDFSPNYNYRSEVSDNPWSIQHPIGTRKSYSTFYEFPTSGDTQPWLQAASEAVLSQCHSGSGVGGPWPDNHPLFYLAVMYQGQSGQNWGTFRIANMVIRIEQGAGFGSEILTGKRAKPGDRWDVVFDVLFARPGYLRVWMKETSAGGDWELVYNKTENTVWLQESDGGSAHLVGGNMKVGMYSHAHKDLAGVQASEALNGGAVGSYKIELFNGNIRRKVMAANDLYQTATAERMFNIMQTGGIA